MFDFLINIFDIVLYRPIFNFLILIYNFLPGHDFGIAVIIVTIAIRLVLYSVSGKALKSQIALQGLQSKLEAIQKKYKDNKEAQAKETLELYKKEKINPFGGLFLAILQLPVLIALYKVFWQGLKPEALGDLYNFIVNPTQINPMFLGFMNLSVPNVPLALLAGIVQFIQTKMLIPSFPKNSSSNKEIASMMQKQMVYIFPIITVIILYRLPSALALYWIVGGLFSVFQQHLIIKKHKTKPLQA